MMAVPVAVRWSCPAVTRTGEERQGDITPDTLQWSIGREYGFLSTDHLPTRLDHLEHYRLVFMGRFRPHPPGIKTALAPDHADREYAPTRPRHHRESKRPHPA